MFAEQSTGQEAALAAPRPLKTSTCHTSSIPSFLFRKIERTQLECLQPAVIDLSLWGPGICICPRARGGGWAGSPGLHQEKRSVM